MKKYFLITIDTEGDNLWEWRQGLPIKTNCVDFLPRFQELCNRYEFKPTWLTNYEIIMNDRYVDFIKKIEKSGTGELGMHLHAWSTPPDYKISIEENGQPYLIEYPENIMEAKIKTMTDVIVERTGIKPVSLRAGRWAMDDRYFSFLAKYGYKYDCSVTPHIDWSNALGWTKNFGGSNYTDCLEQSYLDVSGIREIPVSIRKADRYIIPEQKNFRKFAAALRQMIVKQPLWLRPNGKNLNEMKYIIRKISLENNSNYLMFMLHSSELMPGGSPTFRTEDSIEKMYRDVEKIFSMISDKYQGVTVREFGELLK